MSDCESAKAASSASFARFYFATTFAKKDQCLWQSRHGGDRTDYLHWVLAKQADGSGTAVRHSRCTLLRHIKTAQQRVDLPHRAATTKASKYSRALRKLRRARHPMVRTVGELLGAFGNTLLEIIPLSLCGGSSTAGTLRGVRLDCECTTGLGKHHTIRGLLCLDAFDVGALD